MNYARVAFLQSVAIIVVLLLVIAYVWYHHTGWAPFSFTTGDVPEWAPTDRAKTVARLRFKDCVFSVTPTGAPTTTRDVTGVLNGMAVAYARGNFYNTPAALTLSRPLNAFSFVIPGFNDSATVADPTVSPWCGSAPRRGSSCTSDSQCGGQAGSCTGWPAVSVGAAGCANDYDCPPAAPGGAAGTCSGGSCSNGYTPPADRKCKTDYDCDAIVGSCQNGQCTATPAQAGQCKWCTSDTDCDGVAGSCTGSPGAPGICSICPGAPAVTLKGLVRAI